MLYNIDIVPSLWYVAEHSLLALKENGCDPKATGKAVAIDVTSTMVMAFLESISS